MRYFKKAVVLALVALVLVPVGAFAIMCVNDATLPKRTARYNADLREKVPAGSGKEQLRAWLASNGFLESGYFTDPDQWDELPRSVTLWARDPAWLSSADMFIEVRFDERGRILSTHITSRIVLL